ncbi:MAG TPA: lipid-binding SYLF domain-containing protein [Terriglobales bacterium]|jgi:lipid-binding SYLF domain-containing protein|nr:lipid-binding SYLF domain-containing protein [Terriglobales bacterium]
MKKLIGLSVILLLAGMAFADTPTERMQKAGEVLHQIMATPDKGIPNEVFDKAKCVAVVPHMLKGGFVFGAKHGKGLAICRTPSGWSAPEFFTIGGGSWGAQIGVEGVDLVMMIMNQQGMDQLLKSRFQVGGSASASAGPVGRHASAGVDWKMNSPILTYSRSKGVFAGVDLEGAVIEPDEDAMREVYGHVVPANQVLTGEVKVPASAHNFIAAVSQANMQAKASK